MPHPLTSGTWRCLLNARESEGYVPIGSPLEIPGVVSWWSSKAVADAGGEGYVDGNSVETLLDYSGNGNTFTNAAAGERGIWKDNIANGYGAIRMDNSNDGYVGTFDVGAGNAVTIMILLSPRVNDTSGHSILNSGTNIWTFLGADRGHVLYDGTQNYDVYNKRDASDRGVPVGFALTQTAAKVCNIWVQGKKCENTTMATEPRVIHIGNEGADHNWPGPDCDIIELIIWNRVLDDSEIQDVYIYWRDVYAIKEVYWDEFANEEGAATIDGTSGARSSYDEWGDEGASWDDKWVWKQPYIITYFDNLNGFSDGVSMNGLVTNMGTVVARGDTVLTKSRTFNGSPEIRFRVNNGRLAIPLPFGTDWSSLRVAVLKAGSANTTPSATERISMGVCSGSTNIPGDANVDHFVGCANNAVDGWSYFGGTGDLTFFYIYTATCVDNTWSYAAGYMGGAYVQSDVANYRCGWAVDIKKGSPNFTVGFCDLQYGYANYPTEAQFGAEFEGAVESCQTISPVYHVGRTAKTIAVDEVNNGSLDHFCLWWNPNDFDLEISAILIHRTIW